MSIKIFDCKSNLISDVKEFNPSKRTKSNNSYSVHMNGWEEYFLCVENDECSVHITAKSVDRLVESLLLNKETARMICNKLEKTDWIGKAKNVG